MIAVLCALCATSTTKPNAVVCAEICECSRYSAWMVSCVCVWECQCVSITGYRGGSVLATLEGDLSNDILHGFVFGFCASVVRMCVFGCIYLHWVRMCILKRLIGFEWHMKSHAKLQ